MYIFLLDLNIYIIYSIKTYYLCMPKQFLYVRAIVRILTQTNFGHIFNDFETQWYNVILSTLVFV